MPSNNAKITRAQRECILHVFLRESPALAEARAKALGLADNYALKLARARGLVPRTGKRWAHNLREVA